MKEGEKEQKGERRRKKEERKKVGRRRRIEEEILLIARSSVLMIKRSLSVRSDAIPLVSFLLIEFFSFFLLVFLLLFPLTFFTLFFSFCSFGLMTTSASPITTFNSFFVSLSSIHSLSSYFCFSLFFCSSLSLLLSISPASHFYLLSRSSFRISVVLAFSPTPSFP